MADHPSPSGRQLAEAGLVAPHWPKPWGLEAGPVHQLVIDDELRGAGVRRPVNPTGIGWAGPTLLHAGTDDQKHRYLMPLLAGEDMWCQLFSEPGAGPDLAALSTRAVRDGDEWVVTGRKIWTSLAQFARYGILIARTDPDVGKHSGISYFVCPMEAHGITIRPLGAPPDLWHHGFLFAPALTIGGGTGEVQRNIIGERVLGLPHQPDAESGRTWAEARRA